MLVAVIVLALVAFSLAVLVGTLIRMQATRSRDTGSDLQRLQEVMQVQIQGLKEQVSSSLVSVQQNVQNQISLMGSVQKGLGELSEAARGMKALGEDIVALEELLRPPRFRGEIGEVLLERLLEQIIPRESFRIQYSFRDGKTVDAAIFLQGKIVPVDSKFPLESFTRILSAENEDEARRSRREFARAVRGHIDAVAQYIRPAEDTFEFGLMYVPAENVYYEMVARREGDRDDLCSYALSRRVIPVSPNSFYLYLQSVALGLRGLQLERKAQEVWAILSSLTADVDRLIGEDFRVLGTHLKNAQGKYDDTRRRLERLEVSLKAVEQLPQAEGVEELPVHDELGEPLSPDGGELPERISEE
jgi:DNA recombination protein RmuC